MRLTDEQIRSIDKTVLEWIRQKTIPGVVVGIVQERSPSFMKGYGSADTAKEINMTPYSSFHAASISKLFTATAVMQLAELSRIDIDSPWIRYVPDYVPKDPNVASMTIRSMLSHLTGLNDLPDEGWIEKWRNSRMDEHALRDFVMSQQSVSIDPDKTGSFSYNNIAYEMLGFLVQSVSEMPFETYCKVKIFQPLGMKDSSFLKSEFPVGSLAQPHIKAEDGHLSVSDVYPYHRAHAPSSTLCTTAPDLSLFACAILNILSGQNGQSSILRRESLEQMITPQQTIKKGERIGLGWFISDYDNRLFYGHEGNDIGYRTTFAMIPDLDMAVIVLSNLQTASTRRLMRAIYDEVTELSNWNGSR